MIELNITLFIQFLNFIVTLIALNRILIKPIREVVAQRKNSMLNSAKRIEELAQKIQNMHLRYESIIEKAVEEGRQYYKDAASEASKNKERLLNEARDTARTTIKKTQEALENEVDDARQKISEASVDFSSIALKKLLT